MLVSPFGGCSITLVSPEYAARPVQPLDPQVALAAVNTFRADNGLKPLVLDARLSRAAAMQSQAQAERSWIGHYGSDGSTPKDRAERAGYHAKIASETVASGQKSFSDAMRFREQSSGHRTNLLRPKVTAIGVAMARMRAVAPIGPLSSEPNKTSMSATGTKRTFSRSRREVWFRPTSGHAYQRMECPLMTQSGHWKSRRSAITENGGNKAPPQIFPVD
jgi:cysteine-rich secretory family protein